AIGLVASASVTSPLASLAALSLAALGVWSALGPFWATSAAFASGSAAAGAIALVNSLGNLGGFLGPYVIGLVKERTHGFAGRLESLCGKSFAHMSRRQFIRSAVRKATQSS